MQVQDVKIGYSLLQKKVNKLLDKYGAIKLSVLLDNLSDDIDDTALIAFEKLVDICSKGFGANKKSIFLSNTKNDNVVAARRAIIYIMFNDMRINAVNISTFLKIKQVWRIKQICNYTEQCISGEVFDKDYLDKFTKVRDEFTKEFETLRLREYEKNQQIEKQ